MSKQFFSKLSKNFIEILDDEEYYDITIEVGKDSHVKVFRAHMAVLCYRSPILRKILKKNNVGAITHAKLPNISPDTFQIILRYIYGGIISLNESDVSEILKVLSAADKLQLQELVDYLQKYLLKDQTEWMEHHFEETYRTSFQSNNLSELQQLCIDCIAKSPEKIFKSLDFTLLPEKALISVIERDDLQIDEFKIWDYVLKWGLTQNPTLVMDPSTWSDDDFKMMENTLQNLLPLIRFFGLSSKDFLRKIRPYRRILNRQLYESLLEYHLDPEIELPNNISFPRSNELSSKIININIVSLVSSWIDNATIDSKFAHIRELYLPYEFNLLLRGSRDGFTPNKFHALCDNIPYTIIFIKLKESEEVIGGYNPSVWKDSYGEGKWGKTNGFIFSFKSKNNFKDPILSRVINTNRALFYHIGCGPTFDTDLFIGVREKDGSKEYNFSWCVRRSYEKNIRHTGDEFLIDDYEVFQVTKKVDYGYNI